MLLSFQIDCGSVLDLSDPEVASIWGIHMESFLKPSDLPGAYQAAQEFSTSVYKSGQVAGLLCPDVSRTGNILALSPARLLSGNFIRLKKSELLV